LTQRNNRRKDKRRTAQDESGHPELLEANSSVGDRRHEEKLVDDEKSFPALTKNLQVATQLELESGAHNTGWSKIAVLCQEQEHEGSKQNESSLSSSDLGRLTLLKSTSMRPGGKQQNSTVSNSKCRDKLAISSGANDLATPPKTDTIESASLQSTQRSSSTTPTLFSRRNNNHNMEKLRDRWWELLQQKMASDAAVGLEKRQLEIMHSREQQLEHKAASTTEVSSLFAPTEYSTDDEDQQSISSCEDHEHRNILEACAKSQYPLHAAVLKGDKEVLQAFLSKWQDDDETLLATRRQMMLPENEKERISVKRFTPLHLAVYLDKPLIVSLLLQSGKESLSVATVDGDNSVTPLMLAAELGRDGCLVILLAHGALVTARDDHGNNALHYCCRAGASVSTLKTLLGSRHTAGNGQLYKVLSSRNEDTLQTPLHLACTFGHNHLVEALMNYLPGATVGRLLALLDHIQQTPLVAAIKAGRTNVVMSLLMWSGNHATGGGVGPSTYSKARWPSLNGETCGASVTSSRLTLCPLVAAVQSENVEMVQIVLEFHNPTDSVYNLTDALHAALNLSSDDCKVEMIQLLVDAGANAFREVPSFTSTGGSGGVTALALAMRIGNNSILATLMDSAIRQLETKRLSRRQDPRLQKQPETFFSAMQAKEDSEMDLAMSEALVNSLFSAWEAGDLASTALSSSLLLFRRHARLDMLWLRRCFAAKCLVPRTEVPRVARKFVYAASYHHDAGPNASGNSLESNRNVLDYWSRVLYFMPWMDKDSVTQCPWFKLMMAQDHAGCDDTSLERSDCILLVTAEQSFLVHEAIVSQKSAKLAAAIRFAKMKQTDDEKSLIEVHLNISDKTCVWMLQHMYHGSITSGWAPDNALQCCQDVLELMLVAEEFLCPSLMQECEMRLLSSDPTQCFCWNCCKAVRSLVSSDGKDDVQCLYVVHGPSRLIAVENAVDCLAVSQQVSAVKSVDYLIKFWRENVESDPLRTYTPSDCAWKNFQRNSHQVTSPMALVGDIGAACLLKGFPNLLQQKGIVPEIGNQANNDEEWCDQQARYATLLAVCLDELAANALSQSQSKRVAWTKRFK
jgi:ankyrin repeat protein